MVPSLGMACAAPYSDHGFDIEPAGQNGSSNVVVTIGHDRQRNLFPAHLLLPHEDGIELRFPLWIRFMYEPCVLRSIVIVLTACLSPWTLLGSEPPQNRQITARTWKRITRIIAVFIFISGQIGASSSIYSWLYM